MQTDHIFPRVPFYEGGWRVIMLIINDCFCCRGGSSGDAHRFNSHESRLHIQVQTLDNLFIYHINCLIPWIYTLSIHCHTWYPEWHLILWRLNQPSSHFTLSPTSGELRTSSRLDREGRDGSDSVDLVALSSSPTYPIEASHLFWYRKFFHMCL